ncbi:head-tail connector protein [Klebsiella pneumoniae]|uniref:head-tail connector protein n=1 Tax=Klebsiella pneumoniae TaxID=573 RepID=UPI001FF3F2A0|nr:head-tail connector protein [Klebsiella pneumoniae]MCJ8609769.1 head-tail connector protein [Klebsiella pneumoniae]HCT4709524.1 phage gp6-like head-tail connector protein [Klebsiella pneumoniae]HEL4542790.1 phage gp6-like head-tail connector protein [Klebsiella pneumoniae]HEL6494100.1 phage gp6-like head-tail connector protein [Klebsiella pneumoniae]HEL7601553.1 phage gp6-like head-tail connector protein [Klebsiella pneumoniae]
MEISEEQLAQIKAHLKVDGDDEDTLIAAYASASVDYVERFCDGALVETLTQPVEGETQPREVIFTSGIWAAMLLLIGHWYANREAAAQNLSEVPLGVEALLIRHRRWN